MNQHDHQHQAPAIAGRRLMTTREYKRRMGNPSEMKIWRDEQRGIGPKPVRQNGRRFWFEDEVDAYLEELATARNQNREHAVGEDDPQDGDDPQDCLAERTAAGCTIEGAQGD